LFYALCFLFQLCFCIDPRVFTEAKATWALKLLVSVTAALWGQWGRIFWLWLWYPGLCPGAGGQGLGWGGALCCSAQLVSVFTYGLENTLGTFAGKGDPTTGSLMSSLPLIRPCTGCAFSLTLRIRNTELGVRVQGGAGCTPTGQGASLSPSASQAVGKPGIATEPVSIPKVPEQQLSIPSQNQALLK